MNAPASSAEACAFGPEPSADYLAHVLLLDLYEARDLARDHHHFYRAAILQAELDRRNGLAHQGAVAARSIP